MNSSLSKFRISTPEECAGEVMGKLSNLGAWLGDDKEDPLFENNNGVITFEAQIPIDKITEFKEWFNVISKTSGEIEEYT